MNELKEVKPLSPATLEGLILQGDLGKLSPQQRVEYVTGLCARLGLDPATQPLQLISFQGKTIAYAGRGCAAQLNQLHGLSHQIVSAKEEVAGVYVVNDRCTGPDGRYTEEVGCVCLDGLKGEALSNAIMKARTKASRRATLSHVGLGFLDETETETIPGAKHVDIPVQRPSDPDPEPVELLEWTDGQREEAKTQLNSYGDDLLARGYTEEETKAIINSNKGPNGTLGDPEVGFITWCNRFVAWCERADKRYPAK